MRGGADEAAAYAGARSWMMSEGPRLFAQLNVPNDVRAAAIATPADVSAARVAGDNALAAQLVEIRQALSSEHRTSAALKIDESTSFQGAAAVTAETTWKVFQGFEAEKRAATLASVASRSISREPVYPRRPAENPIAVVGGGGKA
jgi:hypothetical protein